MAWTALTLLILLILLATLTACVFNPWLPPESDLKSKHGVELRGKFTTEEVVKLDDLLAVFPTNVIKSIRSISIVDREGHFENGVVAFCHHTRDICLKPGHVTIIIWHEVGHAHHFYLRWSGSRFNTEWEMLSRGVYNKSNHYAADPAYPKDGVLTGYGSRNQLEDVAVYIEAVYGRLNLSEQYYRTLFERVAATNDPRFKAKIELIRKYGFISEDNYQKFRELVQLARK